MVNVPIQTTAKQIGLSWLAPSFTGGSPILDYNIWYDNGSGSTFYNLVSGLTSPNYIATSLNQGTTYNFEVRARN